ncbi:MAG: hypothetical protein Tsb0020_25840 [Haliangiales bacterium]
MRTFPLLLAAALALTSAGCGGSDSDPGGETVQDLEFSALVDLDGDGASHNDALSTVRLSDYFAANRPGTRLIMLNAAAGWCDPCAREAGALPALAAEYENQGLVILTALFQDQNGDPCDEEFARLWAETFNLSIPMLIDSDFQTSIYFDAMTMPANLLIDAETQQIVLVATGADTGSDPLREYRDFIDSFLAQ